jgi:proline dehydrogenase
MSAWQSMMIGIARSRLLRTTIQRNVLTNRLAGRFVGGVDSASAVARAAELKQKGFGSSLYFLGEYVNTEELVEENVSQIVGIVEELGHAGLDVDLSIDPTQIGYTVSDQLGQRNALRIGQVVARQARRGRNLLMLDMEDFSFVQKTLDLRRHLARESVPTGVTVQAYLFRSEDDVRRLIEDGATVRLVKGAFAERRERAWTEKPDINRNYIRLAETLLSAEAKERGVYPRFGTHDEQMIRAIKPLIQKNRWDSSSYEFEMLYGVRPALQGQLIDEGHSLRLYLPFGTEWWPYAARRIGENPANALFVWKALLSK